jgi:curved DNA-binding protein CbpA
VTTDGEDYYALLGVPRDASLETIRHVYRQLARAYHPDAGPGNPVGEERLKRINEAWETLSDPARRAQYDQGLGGPDGGRAREGRPREEGSDGRPAGRPAGGHGPQADPLVSSLSPAARKLATEQPPGWEYLLFPQVLQDEIDACAALKQSYLRGASLGPREKVTRAGLQAWADPRLKHLDRLVADIESAINVRLPPAFGEPGEPGDLHELVAVARLVGARYREILEWSLRIRSADGPRGFDAVAGALARFPDDVLAKVESAGRPLRDRTAAGIARALAGYPVELEFRLNFELSHREEFAAALKRLR